MKNVKCDTLLHCRRTEPVRASSETSTRAAKYQLDAIPSSFAPSTVPCFPCCELRFGQSARLWPRLVQCEQYPWNCFFLVPIATASFLHVSALALLSLAVPTCALEQCGQDVTRFANPDSWEHSHCSFGPRAFGKASFSRVQAPPPGFSIQ